MPDSSILADVEKLIDKALLLEKGEKYQGKKTCQSLSERKPLFDGKALIQEILRQIDSKWHKGKSRSNNENWRWKKNCRISPKNRSPEVVLERWIVRTTGDDWVNQVPVASGLTSGKGGGRRAIDLVHRCGKGSYEFIELKIDADTPLFAAMEILQYGVLYIFSRDNAKALGYDANKVELLGGTGIHLKVLAPAAYYEGYDLAWLEKSINSGLAKFLDQGVRGFKLEMDFKFESLALIPSGAPVKWRVRA